MDKRILKALAITGVMSTVPAYDALTKHAANQANNPGHQQTTKSKGPESRKPPGIKNTQKQQLLSNNDIIK
jgi:hypothetical protein